MKHILLLLFLLSCNLVSCQLIRFHEKEQLKSFSKGELNILYLERIKIITRCVPYVAIGIEYEHKKSVPITINNTYTLNKQKFIIDSYIKESELFYVNIIPYADSNETIKCILLFETFIREINKIQKQEDE